MVAIRWSSVDVEGSRKLLTFVLVGVESEGETGRSSDGGVRTFRASAKRFAGEEAAAAAVFREQKKTRARTYYL